MADNKLVLHPAQPWAILQDPFLLMDQLREIGLVGSSYPHMGELHYRAGTRFKELVPSQPQQGSGTQPPCHVSLAETATDPRFLGGSNAQPPACRHCGAKFADWNSQLLAWQAEKRRYLWSCHGCRRQVPIDDLNWRRTGGIARYSLDIWEINEGAAEPAPELLQFLMDKTGESWRFFYYRF